ncbi:hypothetical protein [Candidatus Galacturonibacter soehngenii]|nr:hypothetical protein [Candidatus Galacturonibacter soehngenii]
MDHIRISNYNEFVDVLLKAGVSMGGGNNEGIFSVIPWGWNDKPPYDTPVKWHTGDPETDPWEWRMRVLDERRDISYAKVFFKKSGYITKDWAPFFIAIRRGNRCFEEDYENGVISNYAKRIYEVIQENNTLPLHAIKQLAGFGKEDKSQFDRALVELQMNLFLTMCGRQQKVSRKGEEYGWSSTVFCTTEDFWGEEVFEKAAGMKESEAIEELTRHILSLNPIAKPNKIKKFIKG